MATPLPLIREEEFWTADVVNPDGTKVPLQLDADQPGQLSWNGENQSPVTTTLQCIGEPPELLEDQRVTITLWVNGEGYPFPPLVPVKDNPVYEFGKWFQLQVIDETIIYAGDGVDYPLVLPAASPIVSESRDVLKNSAPKLQVSLPSVDHTLRNPLSFGLGTSPLRIHNSLMEALNATPLAPRLDGTLASGIWVPPSQRPVEMEFGPREEQAGYEHRIDLERKHLEAPNVVHYTGNGSSNSDQIIGRWRDEDPFSKWSIERRGRRILAPSASGEAATQEIADERAMRIGMEARGRGRTATIKGLWQPLVPGQVVSTEHPLFPELSALWVVLSFTVSVGGDASDTTWLLQEVV